MSYSSTMDGQNQSESEVPLGFFIDKTKRAVAPTTKANKVNRRRKQPSLVNVPKLNDQRSESLANTSSFDKLESLYPTKFRNVKAMLQAIGYKFANKDLLYQAMFSAEDRQGSAGPEAKTGATLSSDSSMRSIGKNAYQLVCSDMLFKVKHKISLLEFEDHLQSYLDLEFLSHVAELCLVADSLIGVNMKEAKPMARKERTATGLLKIYGAIYLESGFDTAASIIRKHLDQMNKRSPPLLCFPRSLPLLNFGSSSTDSSDPVSKKQKLGHHSNERTNSSSSCTEESSESKIDWEGCDGPGLSGAEKAPSDYAGANNYMIQRLGVRLNYSILKEEGAAHMKSFTIGAMIQDKLIATGKGRSKKLAKKNAAANAYPVILKRFQNIKEK